MSKLLKKLTPEKMMRRNSNKNSTDNDMNNGSNDNKQDGGSQSSVNDSHSSKSLKNPKKSKGKGKAVDESSDELYECEECCLEVDMLVECECCNKWLCITCAKISSKVMKMLLHYKSISFYCETCKPIVKGLIENKGSRTVNNTGSEAEEKLMNIVSSVEKQVKELMEFKDSFTKENANVKTTFANIVKGVEGDNTIAGTITPQSTTTTQQLPINIIDIDEYQDRERRKNNLIVYGIKESKSNDPQTRKEEDTKVIKSITDALRVNDVAVSKIIRLGQPRDNEGEKPRPILLALEDNRKKRLILNNAKKLREIEGWNSIFISPDLTWKEREEGKKLRDQLRTLREEGKNDYIIKRGKIVKNLTRAVNNVNQDETNGENHNEMKKPDVAPVNQGETPGKST